MPDPEKDKPKKQAFGDPGCPEYSDGRPFTPSDEKKDEENKDASPTVREKWWPE